MDTKEAITLLQLTRAKGSIVGVIFNNNFSKVYNYKNLVDPSIKSGDLVVVETQGTYSVASVVDTDVHINHIACPVSQLRHVVGKAITDRYKEVILQEEHAVERLRFAELQEKVNAVRTLIGPELFDETAKLLGECEERE